MRGLLQESVNSYAKRKLPFVQGTADSKQLPRANNAAALVNVSSGINCGPNFRSADPSCYTLDVIWRTLFLRPH